MDCLEGCLFVLAVFADIAFYSRNSRHFDSRNFLFIIEGVCIIVSSIYIE